MTTTQLARTCYKPDLAVIEAAIAAFLPEAGIEIACLTRQRQGGASVIRADFMVTDDVLCKADATRLRVAIVEHIVIPSAQASGARIQCGAIARLPAPTVMEDARTAGSGFVTVLTARPDHPLTKAISRASDGSLVKTRTRMATFFQVRRIEVASIDDLGSLLTGLIDAKSSMIIRGEPTDAYPRRTWVRRIKHARERAQATFRSAPTGARWVCMDFDKVAHPRTSSSDPDALWLHLAAQLPPEFHGVTFWAQWSAGAGLDGWDTLSAHLWFWLDRPVTDDALKAWARAHGVPVDTSLFNAVQPHFTAAPLLADGVDDPCPQRFALVRGATDVVKFNAAPAICH